VQHETTLTSLPDKDVTQLRIVGRKQGGPQGSLDCLHMAQKGEHLIVDNRRARHDYHLLERVEAGLVLTGTEVKSLRDGRASLQQAYADMRNGEAWLVGAHISVYDQGNVANHDPDRDRKLLLHQNELDSLAGKVAQKGLTLVPTKLYFKNGRAKVELALARGKEGRDKRRDIAKREADRDMQRAIKSRR
jgi:SsrA-binding protein